MAKTFLGIHNCETEESSKVFTLAGKEKSPLAHPLVSSQNSLPHPPLPEGTDPVTTMY